MKIERTSPSGRPVFAIKALPIALVLACGSAGAATTYTATDLATLAEGTTMVIRGPNGNGVAAGGGKLVGANRAVNPRKGLLMAPGQMRRIDGFAGSDYTTIMSVNDMGVFVGGANTGSGVRAFRGARDGTTTALPNLADDSSSTAYAVNNQGQAAGFSSGRGGERAVVWGANNTVSPLTGIVASSSRALGINNRGDVVGVVDTVAGRRAAIWAGARSGVELSMLAGHANSEAYGINNRGETVGYSATDEGERHATLWPANGGAVNLGTLPGGTFSQAFGNNDRGDIVGSSTSGAGDRAVIWSDKGGPIDLNTMLSAPGVVLTKAVGINNTGMIVAVGRTVEPGHESHDHHDHEEPVRVFLLTRTGGAR